MKSIELKKGWLFKIAKIGGLSWHNENYGVSICEYNQCILKGALTFIFRSILVLFISYIMINPIVYGIAYVFEYTNILQFMQEFVGVGLIVGRIVDVSVLIFGVISLVYNSDYYYQQRYDTATEIPKEPSAIVLHWRAFKDKVCFTVNFKENP